MKAALLNSREHFEIRDIPEPDLPQGGLILEVKACGICGSDLRRWKEGPPAGSGMMIPGHEIAGIVAEVDRGVADFAVGDRLAIGPDVHCGSCYYCQKGLFNLCNDLKLIGISMGYPGGFAQKIALNPEVINNGIVHPIPHGLSFESACFAEPCSSVLACHESVQTADGDTVLVLGAGPIGCLHVVVAKSRGAKVIVSEPRQERREFVTRFGAEVIVDPSCEDINQVVEEFTLGVGADIVICANPVARTQAMAVEIVRKGGKVVLFGGLPKDQPMTTLNGNLIHYGEISVVGSFSYLPRFHQIALELLSKKVILAEQFITRRFSLDDVSEAYRVASSGKALKVIIMF